MVHAKVYPLFSSLFTLLSESKVHEAIHLPFDEVISFHHSVFFFHLPEPLTTMNFHFTFYCNAMNYILPLVILEVLSTCMLKAAIREFR